MMSTSSFKWINFWGRSGQEGLALDYSEFSHGKYKKLEEEARRNKRGLWAVDTTMSPYCWRWLGTKECNADQYYQP